MADAGRGADLPAPSEAARADGPAASGSSVYRTAPVGRDRPRRDDLPRWKVVLTDLDGARARAFERGEESALDGSDAPGSSAHAIDTALLRSVVVRGARVAGLHQLVEAVRVRETGHELVVLRTVDRLLPYEFVDGQGRVLARIPGRGPHTHDVTLVRTVVGWRVAQVSQVPDTER